MNLPLKITLIILFMLTAAHGRAETSAEARQRKQFFFQGHLGLVAEPSVAASAGFFLTNDLLLEAHAMASTSLNSEAQNKLVSVRGRYFFGNSIYGLVGFGSRAYRRIQESYDNSYEDYTDRESEEFINDLGIEAAMGNTWTINSFMIGLDWAYVYAPIYTTKRTHRIYDEYGEVLTTTHERKGQYAPPIFIAPRLNIGFAF